MIARTATTLLMLAIAASGAAAQSRKKTDKLDRIIRKTGAPIEGVVRKETFKAVTVDKKNAGRIMVNSDEILRIEYYDMPPSFRGVYASISGMNWPDAISALAAAEEYVKELLRDKDSRRKKLAPRKFWFEPALRYYRGLCFKGNGDLRKALLEFNVLIQKFPKSRFIKEAYEMKVECHITLDDGNADGVLQEMQTRGRELGQDLILRGKLLQARRLLASNKIAQARRSFEDLSRSPAAHISEAATLGVIRCLVEEEDERELQDYCEGVMTRSRWPGPRLAAANAIADIHFRKEEFREAVSYYVKSVVLFGPGRGSDMAPEHGRALFRLAAAYEKLAEGADGNRQKLGFARMSLSAYRELSVEYPSGRHRNETAAGAKRVKDRIQEWESEGE